MSATPANTAHFSRKPTAEVKSRGKPNSTSVLSRPLAKSSKVHPLPTGYFEKVFRVQKPKQVEAPPKSQTTAEKFSDQLDEYREELYRDAIKNLQEAEGQQVQTIQSLADRFEQHLSLLGDSETQLNTSIADEQVQGTSSPSNDNVPEASHSECSTLGQSLSDFSKLVESKEATLMRLFDDWNNVQTAIIVAAVQIFGRESVEIEEEQLHESLAVAMDAAAKEHVKMQGKAMATMQKAESLETSAQELTANTELEVDEAVQTLTKNLVVIRNRYEAARRAENETIHGFFKNREKPQKSLRVTNP